MGQLFKQWGRFKIQLTSKLIYEGVIAYENYQIIPLPIRSNACLFSTANVTSDAGDVADEFARCSNLSPDRLTVSASSIRNNVVLYGCFVAICQ